MVTKAISLSNPVYEVLRQLTHQKEVDAALSVALKDLLRLKKQNLLKDIETFEKKYGMTFSEFEEACKDGRIKEPFSYEVEKDDWEWEALLSDKKTLEVFLQWLE